MRIFLILVLVLIPVLSQATRRTEAEMQAAAAHRLNTLRHHPRAKSGPPQFTSSPSVSPKLLKRTETYHIYGTDAPGFAIIATDDRFDPVIGYAFSDFDERKLPCGLTWWLEAADEVMQQPGRHLIRKRAQAYPEIENFVTSQWGQQDPYNWLCPKMNGRNTPCGCVATAAAQVMYYYRYPEQGTGQGGYSVGSSSTRVPGTINSVYEWDKMQDTYKGTMTDERRLPVATLMKEVGLGCYMCYDTSGSGAYSPDMCASLADNFRYNPLSLRHYLRDYFSEQEWTDLVVRELEARRPIIYGAADEKSGGHAFVFSGLNEEGMVYVNWGWDGIGDGYYDLSLLNPTGILGQPGLKSFVLDQHMIIGIKAQATADEGEHYEAHICLPDSFQVKRFGRKLQCGVSRFYNGGFRPFEGQLGFYLVPADDNGAEPLMLKAYETSSEAPIACGFGGYVTQRLYDVSSLPAGAYLIYVAALDKRQGAIQLARSPGGVLSCPLTIGEDGSLSVGTLSLADGISATHSSPRPPYGSDGLTRVFDTFGRLVYTAPSAGFNLWDVPARGVLVVKQGGKSRKVVR